MMKDQVVLTYLKDGVLYPCALTEEQQTMLTLFVSGVCKPLNVITKHPLGQAVNILELKGDK